MLSADGHSWANAAYVTDYLEKQFGEFTRSYPYEGSDPLAFPTSGLPLGQRPGAQEDVPQLRRVREEHLRAEGREVGRPVRRLTPTAPSKVKITATPNLRSLDKYSHPNFPGFPLMTPDVYRAKLFIDELKEFEKKGEFPNLVYLFLPADHTNGTRPGLADAAGDGRRQRPGARAWWSRRSRRASSGRRRASS